VEEFRSDRLDTLQPKRSDIAAEPGIVPQLIGVYARGGLPTDLHSNKVAVIGKLSVLDLLKNN